MDNLNLKKICYDLVDTFIFAGKKSLKLRNAGLKTEYKEDNTPVTNGDLEVNSILNDKIIKITPNLPIISEESLSNKKNQNLENFWLIDPIDGTYDYVNNGEEFTINAALILNKTPKVGLIYAPSKDRMFYSYASGESYELSRGKKIKLNCSKKLILIKLKQFIIQKS